MTSKVPATVCTAPWMHFAVGSHPDGFITMPCCRFRLGDDSRWNANKFENPAFATSKLGYLEQIRQRMLAGERLPECDKCWREERDRGYSMRHTMHKRMPLDEISDKTKFSLRYLEVFFSNLCNLSCRMCSIVDSSQWANLHNNAFLPAGITDHQTVPKHFLDSDGRAKTQAKPFDPSLLQNIDLSDLIEVKILGGEPMMSPDHLMFLDSLMSQSKDPSKIKLVYHTNGTKRPPEKVVEYWKQMDEIEIVFSIDGYDSVNNYQRIGSDWQTIQDNIKWYASLDINFHMRIHTVLSVLTVWSVDKLCEWAQKDFTKFLTWEGSHQGLFNPAGKVITFDFVQRPNFLDITIMPDKAKNKCIEQIKSAKYLTDDMKQFIIRYIKSSSCNNDLWLDFWKKMTAIDNYTKQSLQDTVPELEEFRP